MAGATHHLTSERVAPRRVSVRNTRHGLVGPGGDPQCWWHTRRRSRKPVGRVQHSTTLSTWLGRQQRGAGLWVELDFGGCRPNANYSCELEDGITSVDLPRMQRHTNLVSRVGRSTAVSCEGERHLALGAGRRGAT